MNTIIWQPKNEKEANDIISSLVSKPNLKDFSYINTLLQRAAINKVPFPEILNANEETIRASFANIISKSDGMSFDYTDYWHPTTKKEAENIIKDNIEHPNPIFIRILDLAHGQKIPFYEILLQNEKEIIGSLDNFAKDDTVSYKFIPSDYDFYFYSDKYNPETKEEAILQAKNMLKDVDFNYFSIINHAKVGEAVFSEVLIQYARQIEQNNLKHFLKKYKEKYLS